MLVYNVIILYDVPRERILMCRRRKEPYKGKLNLPGGKLEAGESGLHGAYRELFEECAVGRHDVTLRHLMDFTYYVTNVQLEVYVGGLVRGVEVSGDENELLWVDLEQDFFDSRIFAGEGNIGHMLEQVKLHAEKIL